MAPVDKLMWKGLMGSQSYAQNCRELGNAELGEIVVLGEEHTACLSNAKWSALKT